MPHITLNNRCAADAAIFLFFFFRIFEIVIFIPRNAFYLSMINVRCRLTRLDSVQLDHAKIVSRSNLGLALMALAQHQHLMKEKPMEGHLENYPFDE